MYVTESEYTNLNGNGKNMDKLRVNGASEG